MMAYGDIHRQNLIIGKSMFFLYLHPGSSHRRIKESRYRRNKLYCSYPNPSQISRSTNTRFTQTSLNSVSFFGHELVDGSSYGETQHTALSGKYGAPADSHNVTAASASPTVHRQHVSLDNGALGDLDWGWTGPLDSEWQASNQSTHMSHDQSSYTVDMMASEDANDDQVSSGQDSLDSKHEIPRTSAAEGMKPTFRVNTKTIPRRDGTFLCLQHGCPWTFKRAFERNRHFQTKHGKNTKTYLCSENTCRRSKDGFPRKDKRDEHEQKVHGIVRTSGQPDKTL